MNWVFSLFTLEFSKSDFMFFVFQMECYTDEDCLELETIDAAIHISFGDGYFLLHVMGFDLIAI